MNLKPGDITKLVTPSSRDTIESWLDVLTTMLNLPPAQKTQVRDELEDHLRSRVDDLLITGTPEPEAIRKAVAELGEMAHLAKLITAANKPHHRFRRFTMNAIIIAAAGSLIALGVTTNRPVSTTTLPESAEVVAIDTGIDIAVNSMPFDSVMVDVRDSKLGEMIQKIEKSIERPLIVHWPMLESIGYDWDTPIEIDSAPITAGLAITILAERMEQRAGDSMAALVEDDRIEIGTRSQFDRRTTTKRIYDLSGFADNTSQANPASRSRGGISTNDLRSQRTNSMLGDIIKLLQIHISTDDWSQMGGDLASASILNSSLIVSAPQRMHEEIDTLLSELADQHEAQFRERLMQNQRAFERIRVEYEHARSKYLAATLEVGRIENRANSILNRLSSEPLKNEQRQELMEQRGEIELMIREVHLERDEQERRYLNLQSLLIEAERDQLFAEIN